MIICEEAYSALKKDTKDIYKNQVRRVTKRVIKDGDKFFIKGNRYYIAKMKIGE